jgi:DnaD/phage-associated family protein
MGLARFSKELSASGYTLIDNMFIGEYLQSCGEKALKVYLFGLYAIGSGNENLNTLSKFEDALNMTENDIICAFESLEELGIIEVLSKSPLEVKYIPLSGVYGKPKKIKAGKYNEFTKQVQTLLPDRMITLNEFNEYFNLIEVYQIEPEALVMAIKYCTLIKNTNINYRYILTVAKSWIARGITTLAAAEKELYSFSKQSGEIKEVLKALGLRASADYSDITLLNKWTEQLGFTLDSILYCAKTLKGGGGNMKKLDNMLTEFFKYKKFSIKEIEDYINEKQKYKDTAYAVLKELGEYLPNIDPAIQNYILPWTDKGYDGQTLAQIANYCFKAGIKTLEGMNKFVTKLHKLGLITLESINEYIQQQYETEKTLQKVLDAAGLARQVNFYDRSNYNLWSTIWGINDELILHAANLCREYYNPLKNLHNLLSYYKNNNIFTIAKAQKISPDSVLGKTQKTDNDDFTKREYTKEELNAMFTSIEDYEV